ncbi:24140_t:CDS:2, partial [Cetraspora pellucida]
ERDKAHNSEVTRLTQQMQVLTTGNHSNHSNNNAHLTCYNCEESGHISCNFHINHAATPTQILSCSRNANHISVVDEPDKNINKNEAFTASAICYQYYITQRPSCYRKIVPMPTNKGSHPNQASEIVSAMVLSSKNLPVTTVSIMSVLVISALVMPTLVMSVLAVSILVDTPQDLINMKANVSLGQILQYSDQKWNLSNVIKRLLVPVTIQDPEPIDIEVMTIQAFTIAKITTACCHIRIKENHIVAVLNSSAAISIILNKIVKKLQLKIDEPSTTIVIIANRAKVRRNSTSTPSNKSQSEKLQKPDDEDPFDDFKFNDKNLDKPDRFLTNQCSKLKLYNNPWFYHKSPTMYLSDIKSVLEVDIFAETVDDLEQTSVYIHKINTESAFPIKQVL